VILTLLGKKQSGSWHTILVVVPCLLSEKLSWPSSLMTQSLGSLEWENRHEGLAVLLRANSGLNVKLWFCREAFHVGQTKITLACVVFCSAYTISTAKRNDDRDRCSHFLNILAHVPQLI